MGGTPIAEFGSTANYVLAAGNAHSGGQPNVAPSVTSATAVATLPSLTLPDTLTTIACELPPAATTPLQAPAASASYTFQSSPVALVSNPAPAGGFASPQVLQFAEKASTTAPDGTAGPPVVNGATNGLTPGTATPTRVCIKTGTLPAQPSLCSELDAPGGLGFLCADDNTNPGSALGGAGPLLTTPPVATTQTYNVVSCKDNLQWNTAAVTVTFVPYAHVIAMTGDPADFNANESIAADDGGTAYVSWSTAAGFVYFGLSHATAGVTTPFATTDYVQVYIGSSNGTGVDTADNLKGLFAATIPASTPTFQANFNALYHAWWRVDNTDQGLNAFTGGAWKNSVAAVNNFEVKFNLAGTFAEFAIPLTSIATAGNDVHLVGGDFTSAAGGNLNTNEWPFLAVPPNNDSVNWGNWQQENFLASFPPNDQANFGQP
jgi:hypothetical protein